MPTPLEMLLSSIEGTTVDLPDRAYGAPTRTFEPASTPTRTSTSSSRTSTSRSAPSGSRRDRALMMASALREAGWPENLIPTMVAVGFGESGGNPRAHNPNAGTGDNSYGLWQINMLGRMGPERRRQFGISSNEALFDPVQNARAALDIYRSQGLGAWSVYRKGAHRPYMQDAQWASQASSGGMSSSMGSGGYGLSAGMSSEDIIRRVMRGIDGLTITSTYRDPAHNKRVGGAARSWHLNEANPAMDVAGPPEAMQELYDRLSGLGLNAEILYGDKGHKDHVHFALRDSGIPSDWSPPGGMAGGAAASLGATPPPYQSPISMLSGLIGTLGPTNLSGLTQPTELLPTARRDDATDVLRALGQSQASIVEVGPTGRPETDVPEGAPTTAYGVQSSLGMVEPASLPSSPVPNRPPSQSFRTRRMRDPERNLNARPRVGTGGMDYA